MRLVGIPEAARILSTSEWTTRSLIRQGRLPAVRIANLTRARILIRSTDLLAFINSMTPSLDAFEAEADDAHQEQTDNDEATRE